MTFSVHCLILGLLMVHDLHALSYVPSTWEREWFTNTMNNNWKDRECEILAQGDHLARSRWLLQQIALKMGRPTRIFDDELPVVDFDEREIFSRFIHEDGTETLIEPLIGLLRDPLTICLNIPPKLIGSFEDLESPVQSKRFILTAPAANEKFFSSALQSCQQRILFDFGASTYHGWHRSDDVGSKWFVERYARLGVEFDRIIMFEYQVYKPVDIFARLSPELLAKISYFNIGVSAVESSNAHPWEILANIVKKEDFVAVKLDIDTPKIENALISQLLANETLHELIDEMFYEHHVNTRAMHRYWKSQNFDVFLSDTYEEFTALRQKGIRMHSWP